MPETDTTPDACPFHNNPHPTIRLFRDGSFECLRCGWHGDEVTWVMAKEGLSIADAKKRMAG
jgi:hypothetical protein